MTMKGKSISFTLGGVTLEAREYRITAGNRLVQTPLANGIIVTTNVGLAAARIEIKGLIPSDSAVGYLNTIKTKLSETGYSLYLDGNAFNNVHLDKCVISSSETEGFSAFELELHY